MNEKIKEWADKLMSIGKETKDERILSIAYEMMGTDAPDSSQGFLYLTIIKQLAQQYFRIFFVDVTNDSYIFYDPFDPFADFNSEHQYPDFFLSSSDEMFDTLYEEDREGFFKAFQKENCLREIEKNGEFSIIYRVKDKGGQTYVNMRGTRLMNDKDHIIVGVKNIDDEVRREREFLSRLAEAKEEANRDELTGVRNKHAYMEYISNMQAEIEKGELHDFAIVIFDVNGLKAVNDVLGHQAGDRFIKEACGIICDIFKRSPVFRVGGDEFVAIARGQDYDNIELLMDQLAFGNLVNKTKGGIVIAAGMSRYKAEDGINIKEVFERADAAMYENKKELKGIK